VTSTQEIYELNLATSGKLKLKATARLAEGAVEDIFDACMLLHEAARIERRAALALPACPAATRLAASVEECFCLVEGRDPVGAAEVWGRILREKGDVDEASAQAILSRLAPRYEKNRREFAKLVAGAKTFVQLRSTGAIVPPSANARKSALAEVRAILSRFPGIPDFWWFAYRLAEAGGDRKGAWDALSRARRLDPNNPRFDAMSLLVAARALPKSKADQELARARATLDKAGAEICLMYALAEIELANKDDAEQRWRRAREATNFGLAQVRSEGLRSNLVATQLILDSLLAGKEPSLDLLYLSGLGEIAASASPKSNILELVAWQAKARVQAMETRAAA